MKNLIFICFFFFGIVGFSQKLTFNISNLNDTTIYICKYLGVNLFYADTAVMKKGVVVFDGSKHQSGLYAVVLPGMKYFEFIHDHEEVNISVVNTHDPMSSVKVVKSENNKVFYQYVNYFNQRNTKVNKLYQDLNFAYAIKDSVQINNIEDSIIFFQKEVVDFQKLIIHKYQNLFVADLIRMTLEMELPEFPKDENGVITDSNYVYNYYIKHFWDGINLKDYRLVNTPVYHNKLNLYFSPQGLMQQTDTIIKYADWLLNQMNQTDPNNRLFEYTLSHIAYKYDTMRIVGMDRIFWYMTEYYYCPPYNKAHWLTEEQKNEVCYENTRLDNILIGNYAKPLILLDTSETNWINFYDNNANFTVLFFWSPTCDHCMIETPLLQKLYEQKLKERNIAVYGIAYAIDNDFSAWKKFIHENNLTFTNMGLTPKIYTQMITGDVSSLLQFTNYESLNFPTVYDIFTTPMAFVLDKEKKIVYKQLSVYQLETAMDNLTGHRGAPRILK